MSLVIWHKCILQLAAIQGHFSIQPIGGKGCLRWSGPQLPAYSCPENTVHLWCLNCTFTKCATNKAEWLQRCCSLSLHTLCLCQYGLYLGFPEWVWNSQLEKGSQRSTDPDLDQLILSFFPWSCCWHFRPLCDTDLRTRLIKLEECLHFQSAEVLRIPKATA